MLGIPDQLGGAHQILNGVAISTMLKPPFVEAAEERDRSQLLTFGALMFSPVELINGTRLRDLLVKGEAEGPLIWSRQEHRFIANPLKVPPHGSPNAARGDSKDTVVSSAVLDLPMPESASLWSQYRPGGGTVEFQDGAYVFKNTDGQTGIEIAGLHVNPLDYDFLEMNVRGNPDGMNPRLTASFHGIHPIDNDAAEADRAIAYKSWYGSRAFRKVRIHLSHFWRWYAGQEIDRLAILMPPGREFAIKDIRLVKGDIVAPAIVLKGQALDATGVQTPPGGWILANLDVRSMRSIQGVAVEISKPNFFFDNFENESEDAPSPVQAKLDLTSGAPLAPQYFKTPGYYQLRARCYSQPGHYVGEYSDPVTVRIH
ncbi:MAG TPA: hypothetical protein VHI52_18775 [Verrucomicrobiae bacterium]|nr:hypothetical protein [Verrucomicrobiae bacterium]